MQTSQNHPASLQMFCHKKLEGFNLYGFSHFDMFNGSTFSNLANQGTTLSFQTTKEDYFTLESSSIATGGFDYDSLPAGRSPFPLHNLDHHRPLDSTFGSPLSGSSSSSDDALWKKKLRELEMSLLGPESDVTSSRDLCLVSGSHQTDSSTRWDWNQMVGMLPKLDLKQMLIACAQAVSEGDKSKATSMMQALDQMVSVSGDPIQRLGAYMLEGLRARLEFSGSTIYKALNCDSPIPNEDLLTYMGLLYDICPYWKFAYVTANAAIQEAVEHEPQIHIIDFQMAQGSQWIPLIQALAMRPRGPPVLRITGIDDSDSAHARGGGLHIVGSKLAQVAQSFNVPFEFLDASMSGSEIQLENLKIHSDEAVVVNFPYILHHMPDESVNTWNHRDRLLRLVKSLSPKIVTIVEQESNTNTKPFFPRFLETLDYYTAMFESIDAAGPRDDRQRINAEQNCVAKDIVNMIACQGPARVERHELFGKWKSRLMMAGFTQVPTSPSAGNAAVELLREYNKNYRLQERDGALYLYWMNRPMSTFSAWK